MERRDEEFIERSRTWVLCAVDIYGTALVADAKNHSIRLCRKTGKWAVISLDDVIGHPMKLVVAPADGGIWVVCVGHEVNKSLNRFIPV